MFGLRNMPSGSEDNLQKWITDAGLTAAQTFDFGSAQCYPGTGQKIFDLSGNGYDCFLGADGSSGTDDPTFVGTAGGLSSGEYFSFDGGDFFKYDTTNESEFNGLHKNNATFSFIGAFYCPASVGSGGFCATGFATSDVGISFAQSGGTIFISVLNGSGGAAALSRNLDSAPTTSAWNVIGISINEGGSNVSFGYLNGAYNQYSSSNTFDAAYSSPSAAAATSVWNLGARGGGNAKLTAGWRMGMCSLLPSALSKANFDTLYTPIASRYGL